MRGTWCVHSNPVPSLPATGTSCTLAGTAALHSPRRVLQDVPAIKGEDAGSSPQRRLAAGEEGLPVTEKHLVLGAKMEISPTQEFASPELGPVAPSSPKQGMLCSHHSCQAVRWQLWVPHGGTRHSEGAGAIPGG